MLTLVIYCSLIAIASGVGGMLPSLIRMTHTRMQMTLSLVCGVMLGVALLHLLPHAVQILDGNIRLAGILVLSGLLVMLFLIRIFNFHHHDFDEDHIHPEHCHHGSHADRPSATPGPATGKLVSLGGPVAPAGEQAPLEHAPPEQSHAAGPVDRRRLSHDHSHDCDHDHSHDLAHNHDHDHDHNHDHTAGNLSWLGLCFGLAIHTLMDGFALAAAFQADRSGHWLAGFGAFLAIALHKPLDAISITGLMAAHRFSVTRQLVVNLIFALMAPLGAFGFVFLVGQFSEWQDLVLGGSLAVSAGFFLCISLGDLLPEVHFHSHDRGWLSLMLMTGVAIAFVLEFVIGHPEWSSTGGALPIR